MKKILQQTMQEEAKKIQRMMDQLGRQYRGQSVSTIKPALQRAWKRDGGSISDPELTEYATAISEGRPIKVELK
jgi:hypothetical protein